MVHGGANAIGGLPRRLLTWAEVAITAAELSLQQLGRAAAARKSRE